MSKSTFAEILRMSWFCHVVWFYPGSCFFQTCFKKCFIWHKTGRTRNFSDALKGNKQIFERVFTFKLVVTLFAYGNQTIKLFRDRRTSPPPSELHIMNYISRNCTSVNIMNIKKEGMGKVFSTDRFILTLSPIPAPKLFWKSILSIVHALNQTSVVGIEKWVWYSPLGCWKVNLHNIKLTKCM